jgi:hypothetical protein
MTITLQSFLSTRVFMARGIIGLSEANLVLFATSYVLKVGLMADILKAVTGAQCSIPGPKAQSAGKNKRL